jgi:hypothetical protein
VSFTDLTEEPQQEPIPDNGSVLPADLRAETLPPTPEPLSLGVERPARQDDNPSATDGGDPWPIKPTEAIRVDIRPTTTDLPPDRSARLFDSAVAAPARQRAWPERELWWAATEFWHRPLYFDDVQLERYGQMRHPCLQPILSGAHFFGNIPILPYKTGIDPPYELVPTLGYYRPGSPTPPVGRRLPLETDASLIEAATWVGLILLLP